MRRKIIPYDPRLKELARRLRNDSTKSEIHLWNKLKNKQMLAYDFHRQKPVDKYILDLFCHELMLGIELDGVSHHSNDAAVKDSERERSLNELGITVLRFNDYEVHNDMANVLRAIEGFIQQWEDTQQTHP